jgi:hypothetical protein
MQNTGSGKIHMVINHWDGPVAVVVRALSRF